MNKIWNTQFNGNETKYIDGETFVPGTSETEPGQALDIKTVYDNCTRARQLPPLSSPGAIYDITGDLDNEKAIEDAFNTLDYTTSSNFDMADVTYAQQILAEAYNGEVADGRSSEQLTQKASEERDLKSDTDANSQQKE